MKTPMTIATGRALAGIGARRRCAMATFDDSVWFATSTSHTTSHGSTDGPVPARRLRKDPPQ